MIDRYVNAPGARGRAAGGRALSHEYVDDPRRDALTRAARRTGINAGVRAEVGEGNSDAAEANPLTLVVLHGHAVSAPEHRLLPFEAPDRMADSAGYKLDHLTGHGDGRAPHLDRDRAAATDVEAFTISVAAGPRPLLTASEPGVLGARHAPGLRRRSQPEQHPTRPDDPSEGTSNERHGRTGHVPSVYRPGPWVTWRGAGGS